jgi:DNA-binding MurR/RpiR family transcriptional regulator
MATFEDRIREAHHDLSPSFIILADFLLDSYPQAAFLTATELAHSLDLDPATVVRFAQRLDYPGYPELQREIRRKVLDHLEAHRPAMREGTAEAVDSALAMIAHHLELTRRSFSLSAAEGLIDALDEAARVIVIAEGQAWASGHSLAAWLEAAGYTVHLSGPAPICLARALVGAHRGDLALAVEVEEGGEMAARALAEARNAGMRTAAIVAAPSFPTARYADLTLSGHASPNPGIGKIVVEALCYALIEVLTRARPGRFNELSKKVSDLVRRLESGQAA